MHPAYDQLVAKARASHLANRNPAGITDDDIRTARLYGYAFRLHVIGTFHATRVALDGLEPGSASSLALAWRSRAAETLQELAEKIDVPADALKATIARFNEYAVKGKDPDYNRGWSAQDRYYGDPRVKPNCSLGRIETGPFYAVRIYPGDLGTKGGMITDDHSRVLKEDGQAVPGLYAAGNSTASMMGRTYPGAGGTIGPALTFGFLAAEAAEGHSPS